MFTQYDVFFLCFLMFNFNCHRFFITLGSWFFEESHETCQNVYNINKWSNVKKKIINLTFRSRIMSVCRSTADSTLSSSFASHLKLIGSSIALKQMFNLPLKFVKKFPLTLVFWDNIIRISNTNTGRYCIHIYQDIFTHMNRFFENLNMPTV